MASSFALFLFLSMSLHTKSRVKETIQFRCRNIYQRSNNECQNECNNGCEWNINVTMSEKWVLQWVSKWVKNECYNKCQNEWKMNVTMGDRMSVQMNVWIFKIRLPSMRNPSLIAVTTAFLFELAGPDVWQSPATVTIRTG